MRRASWRNSYISFGGKLPYCPSLGNNVRDVDHRAVRFTAGGRSWDHCRCMRIVDIREATKPIKSLIRNAYIDFSKMTISLVALITDVVRDRKPVVGYGFNSNGRYMRRER
jgi:hypothetical protein